MASPAEIIARLMAEQMQKTDIPEDTAETSTVPEEQPNQSAEIIQLPVWPDSVRGMPNSMLRSALFGAIKRGPRAYLKQETIAALEGINIRYTGERLDQGDLDVWQGIVHIARAQSQGNTCQVTAYALLKVLGKTNSGDNHKTLYDRLVRLRANAIEIETSAYNYVGGLVDEVVRDNDTKEYTIRLNPKLGHLFGPDQFTLIEFEKRAALSRHPLAQWLYGFYSSHANPYPIKVETLHGLCGSETKLMKHFRAELKKSLEKISDLDDWEWQIDAKDLVHIKKRPSNSQTRHLARKGKSTS